MKCVETPTMNEEELNELFALKSVISYNPASVSTDKMELFTELLVKSFKIKQGYFIEPKTIQTTK
jgi:hypothetical protein